MIWRRIARMLGFRHAAELQDERSTHAEQLAVLGRETKAQEHAIREMTRQSRTGDYSRIRGGAIAAQSRLRR